MDYRTQRAKLEQLQRTHAGSSSGQHERGKFFADRHVSDVVEAGLERDWAVAGLATLQHGVVTRAQLLAVGLGAGAIHHRVEAFHLHRVYRGVYLVGHTAPTPLARETAALLACGRYGVLSHLASGCIWDFSQDDPKAIDVTVTAGGRRSRKGIRIHHSPLTAADVTVRRRLPLTTPERTLVDLAHRMPQAFMERAVEDARRRRLITRKSLSAALERAGRRPGAAALRALVRREGGPAFTRSEAEVRLVALIRRAGLPPPEHNVQMAGHEVDLLWREEALVVEIDGYAYHSGRAAFERDRARDADLMAAGLRVLRITWRQLTDEPERVVALVASGLRPLPGPAAGRGLAAPPR
jgi:very-short-patch-repair endonuclease